MTLTEFLISEIEHETVSTQKMLERVPADQFDWTPHPKSMNLKALATHTAQLAGWAGLIATTSELNFAYGTLKTPEISTASDLVNELTKGTQASIEALKTVKDEDLNALWTLKMGEQILMQLPKKDFIRYMALNHLIHHRAQLSVYLRLLNVPIPGMYGPSADDRS